MEEVLDVYEAPYDPQRPVVCFDETPCQLFAEARPDEPARPGQPARRDSEYVRHGVAEILLACEPKTGQRQAWVTEHRTKVDFAQAIDHLVAMYASATVIRVVLDNLSTHKPGALYEVFPPDKARALLQRLEFHFTPKHGSWLNMAEIEFAALSSQCLDRHIPDIETLRCEVAAWTKQRNAAETRIHWNFTTRKARSSMTRCYPSQSTG